MAVPERATVRIELEPLWTKCPRCGYKMRRDYTNGRTILSPNRTLLLTLQIIRCNNTRCSRYRRPHRPEVEWHYALPGSKFALDTCAVVFAAQLKGDASRETHEYLAKLGLSASPRSITNVIRRYERLFSRPASAWSREELSGMKSETKAILDVLVGFEDHQQIVVLVRECFSNCVLAGTSMKTSELDEGFRVLFHSILDRLPVPVVQVFCPHSDAIRSIVTQMLPRAIVVPVQTDGVTGKRRKRIRT